MSSDHSVGIHHMALQLQTRRYQQAPEAQSASWASCSQNLWTEATAQSAAKPRSCCGTEPADSI